MRAQCLQAIIPTSAVERASVLLGVNCCGRRLGVAVCIEEQHRSAFFFGMQASCPYRLVVRTSRRGRDNPGSTPGEDMYGKKYSHNAHSASKFAQAKSSQGKQNKFDVTPPLAGPNLKSHLAPQTAIRGPPAARTATPKSSLGAHFGAAARHAINAWKRKVGAG
jgi:hypothetical protein